MIHDDLRINKSDLDEEWKGQPRLYYKYSEQLANAIHRRDRKKAELDLKRAEITYDIRNNPDSYEMDKTTDSAVTNKVIEQTDFQIALLALNDAERDVNILQGAVWAAQHKKVSLESLTRLFLANYYAEDTHVSDKQKEEVIEKQVSQLSREGLEKSPMLSRRRTQIEEGGSHEK